VSITSTLIVQMIVFLILIGFTMKFIWPPITAALDARAQKVAEGLSAADKAKAELAVANQRVDAGTQLIVVDAILTGTHEPGTSHHEMLRAFVDDEALDRVDEALRMSGYRTHEFGDSILIARRRGTTAQLRSIA